MSLSDPNYDCLFNRLGAQLEEVKGKRTCWKQQKDNINSLTQARLRLWLQQES